MASTVISGFAGTVTATNAFVAAMTSTTAHIYEWSATITNDTHNYMVFGNAGGKRTIKNSYLITGTVRGYHGSTNEQDIVATELNADLGLMSLVLLAVTGYTYTFSAHCVGIPIVVSRNTGPATIDFNFMSDGDLTVAAPAP